MSVIIPTRDRADLLAGAISALQAQTYPELEIIVVDDGSRDRTSEAIAEAAARDPRLRAVRHERSLGAAAARNTGATLARGLYLLFEDDDCRGEPERVALLVDALERSPEAAYAYCYWRVSRGLDRSVIVRAVEDPWSMTTSAALLRANAFRAAGEFDADLPRLQDFDLWTRLLARAPAVGVPEILFEMSRDETGISASSEGLLAAAEHLLRKYRDGNLPAAHLAAMHRRLGGKLMVAGFHKAGLVHFLASVRMRKRSPRSWFGLAAGAAGPAVYRVVARLTDRLRRIRSRGSG